MHIPLKPLPDPCVSAGINDIIVIDVRTEPKRSLCNVYGVCGPDRTSQDGWQNHRNSYSPWSRQRNIAILPNLSVPARLLPWFAFRSDSRINSLFQFGTITYLLRRIQNHAVDQVHRTNFDNNSYSLVVYACNTATVYLSVTSNSYPFVFRRRRRFSRISRDRVS
jgi:hypothetical protein